ncbi:MAG: 50S ribosomal protein L29 [Candidatus Melainabacteria bacterium GWF2_37_15]|nr:MAG: 50S ribosomal protein L29 [Candidatus Melainabacteria bacterium GWF2_37_15]
MKLTEIREHTIDELKDKIISLRKELFDLKIQKATFKLENVADIEKKRKLIAQIKTIIKEKGLKNA